MKPLKPIPSTVKHSAYDRDKGCCVHCGTSIPYSQTKFDRITVRNGSWYNHVSNVVSLCARCYALRASKCQDRAGSALSKGVIPANWRESVWDDEAFFKDWRIKGLSNRDECGTYIG